MEDAITLACLLIPLVYVCYKLGKWYGLLWLALCAVASIEVVGTIRSYAGIFKILFLPPIGVGLWLVIFPCRWIIQKVAAAKDDAVPPSASSPGAVAD